MRADIKFTRDARQALESLGPVRMLELLGDLMLEYAANAALLEEYRSSYRTAVDHIGQMMHHFEEARKGTTVPGDQS